LYVSLNPTLGIQIKGSEEQSAPAFAPNAKINYAFLKTLRSVPSITAISDQSIHLRPDQSKATAYMQPSTCLTTGIGN
jgi:hypothetical protein